MKSHDIPRLPAVVEVFRQARPTRVGGSREDAAPCRPAAPDRPGAAICGTRASFSTTGTCELELWVSDSEFENSTQVSVTVTEAP